MKKIFLIILSLYLTAFNCVSAQVFEEPVPDATDEVTTSGPDTKYTLATDLLFDSFDVAEITVPVDFIQDKKVVPIYKVSKNGNYLQKIKIPNAKITEYTNGSYDIRFKDIPHTIFNYDKNGDLQYFVLINNNEKIPFTSYHYNTDGKIIRVEIKPQRYHSYIYNLEGILVKYVYYDKVYTVDGKVCLRKKSPF